MAGVSAMTVSNVIHNKKTKTSEETRELIHQLIQKNNYKPNAFARNLVTGKSNIIGLMIPDVSNPFFSCLIQVVEDAANKSGYSVLLCNTHDDAETEQNYIDVLLENGIDGMIVASSAIADTNYLNELARGSFPVVTMDRLVQEEDDIHGVVVDDFKGSYDAVNHLIELGHRKIGCITGSLSSFSCAERLRGYQEAMKHNGLPIEQDWIYSGKFTMQTGIIGAEKLLKHQVTAIMACGDILAYGVYRKAAELNLEIPKDLSVVGFDDLPFSDIITPPLTTVKQPILEMSNQITQLLFDLLGNKKVEAKLFTYPTKLIMRESTSALSYN